MPAPIHIYEAPDGWPAMRLERDLSLEPRLCYVGAFDMPAALDLVEQMTDAARAVYKAGRSIRRLRLVPLTLSIRLDYLQGSPKTKGWRGRAR